jgi:hypothetical protein
MPLISIHNSLLKENFEDELREGLVEGEDYILFPKSISEDLFKKYSGGPRFVRDVINVGSIYIPTYKISLYRIRIEAYMCNKSYPLPDKNDIVRYLVKFYPKTTEYKTAVEGLILAFGVSVYSNAVRAWIKGEDQEQSSATNSAAMECDTYSDNEKNAEKNSSSTSSDVGSGAGGSASDRDRADRAPAAGGGGGAKRARVGRMLTSEVTAGSTCATGCTGPCRRSGATASVSG